MNTQQKKRKKIRPKRINSRKNVNCYRLTVDVDDWFDVLHCFSEEVSQIKFNEPREPLSFHGRQWGPTSCRTRTISLLLILVYSFRNYLSVFSFLFFIGWIELKAYCFKINTQYLQTQSNFRVFKGHQLISNCFQLNAFCIKRR